MHKEWVSAVALAVVLSGCNLFKKSKSSSEGASSVKAKAFAFADGTSPSQTSGAEDPFDPSCDCAACAAIPRPTESPGTVEDIPTETSTPTDPSEWDAIMSQTIDKDSECICPELDGDGAVPSPANEVPPSPTSTTEETNPQQTTVPDDSSATPTPSAN